MFNKAVLFCSLFSIICLSESEVKVFILTNYLDCRQIYHDHGDYDYQYTEFYEVTGSSSLLESFKFQDEVTDLPSEPDDSILYFKVAVEATSDFHILLATYNSSEHKTISDAVYEITIGFGVDRSKLWNIRKIRRGDKAETRVVGETVKEFSNLHPVLLPLWIRISKNGVIKLGEEHNQTALVSWTDPDQEPIPVNVVSFSARVKDESKFYFDCPEPDRYFRPNLPTTAVHIPSTPELVESAMWLLPSLNRTPSAKSPDLFLNTTVQAENSSGSQSMSACGAKIAFFISFAFLIFN